MSVFKKATKTVDPVEEARTNVNQILDFFTQAKKTVANAADTIDGRVESNKSIIVSLSQENAALNTEASGYKSVVEKLAVFTP